MFWTRFDPWHAETIEEHFLFAFMRTHVCAASIHAYASLFISSYKRMPQHVYACYDPAYAYIGLAYTCWHLETLFFA